jgi:dTDP-glucose pyrophosphorylase
MDYPEQISQRFIENNSTILQALQKMDRINKKLLLVLKKGQFIGVLSIGDVQKAIISNHSFDVPIERIMRKEFVYATTANGRRSVLELMKKQRIECMPIVNETGALVDAYMWEDVFEELAPHPQADLGLPVVIMAGGKGTRLKPLTNVFPKPLIPFENKTIIESIMDKFCQVGCNEFYLSVNYKAEIIKYYFSSLKNSPYKIDYIQETKPLGTAGSLHLLKGRLNSTFFVSNCDIVIEQDYADILDYHQAYGNEITVVAAIKNYAIPYGILETEDGGKLSGIIEKPDITYKINTGFYIFEPHLLDEIPENEFYNLTTLIDKLIKEKRKVGVFPISERSWKDIGEWKEYEKFME